MTVQKLVLAGMMLAVPVSARAQAPLCSVGMLEGTWVFATGMGQLSTVSASIPARLSGKQVTALGTFTVDSQGNINGKFDQTTADIGINRNAAYTGTMTVNADCMGTISITTRGGTSRTDSFVVALGRDPLLSELWGMSQIDSVMWTYVARRISTTP